MRSVEVMPICQPIRFNFLKTRDVDWSNQVNPNLEAVFTNIGSSDNAWPSPSIGRIDLFPKGGETFSVICTSILKDSIFQMWHSSHIQPKQSVSKKISRFFILKNHNQDHSKVIQEKIIGWANLCFENVSDFLKPSKGLRNVAITLRD